MDERQRGNKKKMSVNIVKRWNKSFECTVVQVDDVSYGKRYIVLSSSGAMYSVFIGGHHLRRCNCEYGSYHRMSCCCAHVITAARYEIEKRGYEPLCIVGEDELGGRKYFRLAEDYFILVGEIEYEQAEISGV